MGGPVVGEGRLGRPLEQVDRRRRIGAAARRLGPVVDLEGQLEMGEGVGQRVDALRLGGRLDRGGPGRTELVGRQPVTGPRSGPLGQALGKRRVVTAALARQQVGFDRPGDQRMANPHDRIGRQGRDGRVVDCRVAVGSFELGEAVLEGVGEAVAKVGLQDAAAAPWRRARARGGPVGLALEGE